VDHPKPTSPPARVNTLAFFAAASSSSSFCFSAFSPFFCLLVKLGIFFLFSAFALLFFVPAKGVPGIGHLVTKHLSQDHPYSESIFEAVTMQTNN